jgi:hypothetical protein
VNEWVLWHSGFDKPVELMNEGFPQHSLPDKPDLLMNDDFSSPFIA